MENKSSLNEQVTTEQFKRLCNFGTIEQKPKARPSFVSRIESRSKPRARKNNVPGVMNKTEKAYSEFLQSQLVAGEINDWKYEPEKFKLAASTFYTPDFRVVTKADFIEFHEVKACRKDGQLLCEDDAKAKFKIAAELHWMYGWRMVGKLARNAGWKQELCINCEDSG